MDGFLKQGTAHTFQFGAFLDETDGKTAETGLTIAYTDIFLSKDGGAGASKTDTTDLTGTSDARGYYDCVLGTTDTNTLGTLKVMAHISGALPVWSTFQIITAAEWDRMCGAGASVADVKAVVDNLPSASAIQTEMEEDGASLLDTIADAIANGTYGLSAIRTRGDAAWITATGFSTHSAADVWAVGTRALTDKADFALSSAARDAIWDQASAIGSLSFEALVTRLYQLLNNRLEVTDSSGAASLKALGNGTEIATSNISDNDTLTDRDEWDWT